MPRTESKPKPPGFIVPMAPTLIDAAPKGDAIKFDGLPLWYRVNAMDKTLTKGRAKGLRKKLAKAGHGE